MKDYLSVRNLFPVTLCALLVVVLILPTYQWLFPFRSNGSLYGYTPPANEKPIDTFSGFFEKSTQPWVENYYASHLGFRAILVRSFNELIFTVFGESASRTLVRRDFGGLFNDQTINSLNNEIILKDQWREKYSEEAEKLSEVDRVLNTLGKHLIVVIASSKGYVYPEGLGNRYIHGGSENLFGRMASFPKALASQGIRVLDTGPMLRELTSSKGLETHPFSGVHWNFYSGCLIGEEILREIGTHKFQMPTKLFSGFNHSVQRDSSDVDAYLLLNIWFEHDLLRPTPFPIFSEIKTKKKVNGHRPNLLFIGDSFSDQIRECFKKAEPFSRIIFSSYFGTRVQEYPVDSSVKVLSEQDNLNATRNHLLEDLNLSDIVILEMVDYNTYRLGYGFSDFILSNKEMLTRKPTQQE